MEIIIPILVVTVIGLICAIMLVVASKFMTVPEDAAFTEIRACLPGANCGACGYAGCDGYAHALADGESKKTNLCVPGGPAAAEQIAAVLGLEAEAAEQKAAYVACCGDSSCTGKKHEYHGIMTCAAAEQLFSGDSACSYGCLGYGDCTKSCPNDAICVENGLAHIRLSLCIGCGLCAKACPNKLIHIIPASAAAIVRCSSQEKGAVTRKACQGGCIGCKKCERECPSGAITVQDNCASIDYSKCTSCGRCAEVCVTGCITPAQFASLS